MIIGPLVSAHSQEILHRDPYIVYPGNLQGRKSQESGPKGATLVAVDDNRVVSLEPRALDVIRWSVATVDLGTCTYLSAVYAVTREVIERELNAADGRGLALRLYFSGTTAIHNDLVVMGPQFREEVETIAATLSDEIWVERVELLTAAPGRAENIDPTVAGRIRTAVEDYVNDPAVAELLGRNSLRSARRCQQQLTPRSCSNQSGVRAPPGPCDWRFP